MAKRKPTISSKSLEEENLIKILRSNAQRYLKLPGVTSVGVGYKIKDGEKTDQLCIQFTVRKKLSTEKLKEENLPILPESIKTDNEIEIPVDVIERSYHPSYEVIDDGKNKAIKQINPRRFRRNRSDILRPGISISHYEGTAGTLGAIVYDNDTAQPYVLSNWHVLHGPNNKPGDDIVQPGPYDDGHIIENYLGKLVRSHIGLAGDCAIASIDNRKFDEKIFELDITPKRIGKVNIGDKVVKSGRTTGVTYGIVSRVGVVTNLRYLGDVTVRTVGGFEIGPNPDKPSSDGEISKGGDSGSIWLVDTDDDYKDVAVGLHFAGETDPDPKAEHAVACNIHSVFEKLGISFVDDRAKFLSDEELWNTTLTKLNTLSQRVSAIENLPLQLCKSNEPKTDAQRRVAALEQDESSGPEVLPVYGNWCGPRFGSGPAIDDIDRACMHHDQCYERHGYFACHCDANLIHEIDKALASGNVRLEGRLIGPLIRAWFSNQPCVHREEGVRTPCTGAEKVFHTAYQIMRVEKEGEVLWKILRR